MLRFLCDSVQKLDFTTFLYYLTISIYLYVSIYLFFHSFYLSSTPNHLSLSVPSLSPLPVFFLFSNIAKVLVYIRKLPAAIQGQRTRVRAARRPRKKLLGYPTLRATEPLRSRPLQARWEVFPWEWKENGRRGVLVGEGKRGRNSGWKPYVQVVK